MKKTLLALSAAGGIGIASLLMQSDAGKSQEGVQSEAPTTPQPVNVEGIQTFLTHHPEHQDAVVNYIIRDKEIQGNHYSLATLRSLGEVVEENIPLYPVTLESSARTITQITLRSPTGPRAFENLEAEVQFEYVKQFFAQRAVEYHETKYELLGEWCELLGQESEYFFTNVRRRVFGKE